MTHPAPSNMRPPKKHRICKCGRQTTGPTATYCYDCRKERTYRKTTRTEKPSEAMRTDLAQLELLPAITYPHAAAFWLCSLKDAIKRVNALVRADLLRGIDRGRFELVKEEKW